MEPLIKHYFKVSLTHRMESVIMCKVIGFTNFNKVGKKIGTVEYIGQLLLDTERDGFGYAMWDKNTNSAFGERTTERSFSSALRDTAKVNFDFCEEPFLFKNKFGNFDLSNVGAAIFHGRISTNNKTLNNTHPMVKHGWSLIHNGVVTDLGEKYTTITTNDSEHVLERYVDGSFEENLQGYYAFLAIDPTGKLHVVKDKIAHLYSSWIDSLDTYMFSTNEDNIKKVCSVLGVGYSTIKKVKDDQLVVLQDNTILEARKINSRGYSWNEAKHADKSLGRSLNHYGGNSHSPKETTTLTQTNTTKTNSESGTNDKVVSILGKYDKKKIKERKKAINSAYRSLTEDEKCYIFEVEQMDGSYTVINPKGKRVQLDTFKRLDFSQQIYFEVIRPDGTVVDWLNYNTDRLSSYNR
jgi:hypothetical protein